VRIRRGTRPSRGGGEVQPFERAPAWQDGPAGLPERAHLLGALLGDSERLVQATEAHDFVTAVAGILPSQHLLALTFPARRRLEIVGAADLGFGFSTRFRGRRAKPGRVAFGASGKLANQRIQARHARGPGAADARRSLPAARSVPVWPLRAQRWRNRKRASTVSPSRSSPDRKPGQTGRGIGGRPDLNA
jgi:hypothetical protein